ncbi:hypothetical protein ACFXTN_027606 [Malus domestica]
MGNGYSPSPDSTSSSPLSLTPSVKLDSFLDAFWGLTSKVMAKRMLQSYGCEGYRMRKENGCVLISWQDRPLFSVSAWRCRK